MPGCASGLDPVRSLLSDCRSHEVVITVRSMRVPLAAGLLMLAVSACDINGISAPPRYPSISMAVMVSHDGRVITVRAVKACGHRPHLIARSYPHRVTLRLVNPDIDCHAEVFPVVNVRAILPQPLGARELVHATTGKPVRYHLSQSSG